MQTRKKDIRTLILAVAREEFLRNGVKNTSMKTISLKSGVAVGNIYNYFENKSDLLKAVLSPLIKAFEEYREKNRSISYFTIDVFKYDSFLEMMYDQVASVITPYRDEMRLLLFETAGTSLEKFFQTRQDYMLQDGIRYLQIMKEKYPYIDIDISPHFLHILCTLWYDVVKEIVLHQDMSQEEINLIIKDYVKFTTGGWKYLLNIP